MNQNQIIENVVQFPPFWETIEKTLALDSVGIKEIKEILTIFQYNTAESIMKFAKHDEIRLLEFEFLNRKLELTAKFPHLHNFTFASGFYSNLSTIASKIKKNYVEVIDIDIDRIVDKVLDDGKKVFIFLLLHDEYLEPTLFFYIC